MTMSRSVRTLVCPYFFRMLTAFGLCALLMLNGMPPLALAAPVPARGASRVHVMLAGYGLPLSKAARLSGPAADDILIEVNDAVRFLEQATFGPTFGDATNPNSVAHVQLVGFAAWLSEQFNAPVTYPDDPAVPNVGVNYPNPADPGLCNDDVVGGAGGICFMGNRPDLCTNNGPSTCQRDNFTAWYLQNIFFQNALLGPDQLRQRIAWSLSQIDVVSQQTIDHANYMVPYIQVFDRDAFGNFRQLLYDITVNPAMGQYLDMRGNSKTNVNENYAREILQLFSVGLNLLNPDGTVQLDTDGNAKPTYSQDTITAFARVFTGWNLDLQLAPGVPNYRDPMIVANRNNHDTGAKTLLNGLVLDGTDTAEVELSTAIDNIFNHPNVGPYIGKLLIQQLVTSNPSPAYVARVTAAFNDDGTGTRGNMQAVIKAILLDPEARTAPTSTDVNYGHLREPVLFITNTLRALGTGLADGSCCSTDFTLGDQFLPNLVRTGDGLFHSLRMDQDVFRPPTVFSYYPPDNVLQLAGGGTLIAPEFGIQSTSTALSRINFMRDVAFRQMPTNAKDRPSGTWIDTTAFEPEAAGNATALLDDLNNRLMHGTMTGALYTIVQNAVLAVPESDPTTRVQEAIYLIASSSQYQVER
ncbi:MAG TPA: DUF1800 domain-containing protein [Candidatus Dormibacteraeota bacterium]|nr:DUF1800 domain-containing protein [Candidatus Dormibacteraeota bacterium]